MISAAPAEVIVVGAGIVGAATAEALAQRGLRVTLIDAAAAGSGVTAAGMGHLVVMDDSPAQLALTQTGLRMWNERLPELGEALEPDACGTLWLARDATEMERAGEKAALLRDAGIEVALLDAEGLRRREPVLARDLAGALHVPGDRVLYPPAAAAALAARARAAGARWMGEVAVERVIEGGVRLVDGRTLEAEWVVDAAGLAALDLIEDPPPEIRLRPRKGHLVITDRHPGFCRHQLVELGYLDSAHGADPVSIAFNLQPRRTGQLLLGSSRQYDVLDSAVEADILGRMIRRAKDFVPGLGNLSAIRAWTGQRAATSDHLPLIGPLPGRERILLAAGHEGLGITTALVTGALLAAHILEAAPPIDPSPFRPERFVESADDE